MITADIISTMTATVAMVVEVTHARVAAQRLRYPQASPATVAIWDRLAAWQGDREEIRAIRRAAALFDGDDNDAADNDAAAAFFVAADATLVFSLALDGLFDGSDAVLYADADGELLLSLKLMLSHRDDAAGGAE